MNSDDSLLSPSKFSTEMNRLMGQHRAKTYNKKSAHDEYDSDSENSPSILNLYSYDGNTDDNDLSDTPSDDGFLPFGDPSDEDEDEDDSAALDAVNRILTELEEASPPGIPPWMDISPEALEHNSKLPVMAKLHNEILDFVDYISPTKEEIRIRNEVVDRISKAVKSLWPEAEVKPFGSYMTGLFLPFADVDLVIIRPGTPSEQKAVADRLKYIQQARSRMVIPECDYSRSIYIKLTQHMGRSISEIEVVAKAKIPIVKFIDNASGLKVDICLNTIGGLETGQYMVEAVKTMPALKPLVLVLKYFLFCRALNETYSGGIGSFLLQCMVVALLQRHPSRLQLNQVEVHPDPKENGGNEEDEVDEALKMALGKDYERVMSGDLDSDKKKKEKEKEREKEKKKKKKSQREKEKEKLQKAIEEEGTTEYSCDLDQHVNLGVLLYSFFDMYTHQYNYLKTVLNINDTGMVYKRYVKRFPGLHTPGGISLENPTDSEHDVGANSYQIARVRQAFNFGFNVISGYARRSVDENHQDPDEYTILQHLLPLTPELLQVRPKRTLLNIVDLQETLTAHNEPELLRENNRIERFNTSRMLTKEEREEENQRLLEEEKQQKEEKAAKKAREEEERKAEKEQKRLNKKLKKEREKKINEEMKNRDMSVFDDGEESVPGTFEALLDQIAPLSKKDKKEKKKEKKEKEKKEKEKKEKKAEKVKESKYSDIIDSDDDVIPQLPGVTGVPCSKRRYSDIIDSEDEKELKKKEKEKSKKNKNKKDSETSRIPVSVTIQSPSTNITVKPRVKPNLVSNYYQANADEAIVLDDSDYDFYDTYDKANVTSDTQKKPSRNDSDSNVIVLDDNDSDSDSGPGEKVNIESDSDDLGDMSWVYSISDEEYDDEGGLVKKRRNKKRQLKQLNPAPPKRVRSKGKNDDSQKKRRRKSKK